MSGPRPRPKPEGRFVTASRARSPRGRADWPKFGIAELPKRTWSPESMPRIPETMTMRLPFTAPAKKNQYRAFNVRRPGKPRPVPCIGLSDEGKRLQNAVWLWAAAELLYCRGMIEQTKRDEMRTLAVRHLRPGNGVGEGLISSLRVEFDTHSGGVCWRSEHEVAVSVVPVVGKSAQDDHVIVHVALVGVLPDLKRTGRKRDVDGTLTTVLDGLKGAWYYDDRQVRRIAGERIVATELVNPIARAAALVMRRPLSAQEPKRAPASSKQRARGASEG